jgi:predicted GNAT superfamily acetyltransferase
MAEVCGVSDRGSAPGSDHDVRPLDTAEDYAACVALQQATWGAGCHEIVPASMLKITQRLGGVATGAFDRAGRLIGFLYGVTGPVEGRLVHWSHMLAVAPSHRNRGVGRRLKLHQRELLRLVGAEELRWTFDPLVARNGHLNLNVLGAEVVEYVVDAYGDTGSDLHAFGTDRLVVRWPVAANGERADGGIAQAVEIGPDGADGAGGEVGRFAPLMNGAPSGGRDRLDDIWSSPVLRVEVPPDVESMRHSALRQACAWRAATRDAFLGALGRGYEVVGFSGRAGEPGHYLLRRRGT